tara:strand:+ start:36 stop:713 length:678 start_codon:yes stop_codon:yes gene_type:complete
VPKKLRYSILLITIFGVLSAVQAGSLRYHPWSFTAKIGTTGLGADISKKLGDKFKFRIGASFLDFDYDATESNIDYGINIKMLSLSGIIDYHPFSNGFRISSGLMYNQNELNLVSETNTLFNIGGDTYTINEVSAVNGNIDFGNFRPYLGVGYDTSYTDNDSFGLTLDLGVIYQGDPDISLRATGPNAQTAQVERSINRETQELEEDFDTFKIYPVVNIGVNFNY